MSDQPQRIGAVAFRQIIETEGKLVAARLIAPQTQSDEEAQIVIRFYVEQLLGTGTLANMCAAGLVLWGNQFNPRPTCVRKVLRAIHDFQRVLVMGSSSVGKTYSATCWLLLRWWQDPLGTTIKLISTTGTHAESNIFGTLKRLHADAIVPMAGFANSDMISATPGDKRAAIAIVRVQKGEDNSGVLQGFHPLPRKEKHPLFGDSTSVIAALDEVEEIAGGWETGASNMTGSGDAQHVKIMGFFNPKDQTSKTAHLTEPQGGWGDFDPETGVQGQNEWESREKWHVLRLDAKQTENVQERREVYPRFQSWEGYRGYETKEGGNSQHYWVFARGCYPPDSAINTVTPQRVIAQMRGEYVFTGPAVKYASCDTAIDGRDDAVFSVGRYGFATAFKRTIIGSGGTRATEVITFKNPRKVAQLDQQFALPKGSTEIVARGIMEHCVKLGVLPENYCGDATGNGEPVHILLRAIWSPKVRGVRFGDDATNLKMLDEDIQTAAEQYFGVHSEVLFAITRWGEAGYLSIAPTVQAQELERQLGGRRYILGPAQTLKVEDKKDYKKRLGRSPDHAESFACFLHAIRTGGKTEAAALVPDKPKKEKGLQFETADIESIKWLQDGDSQGF